MAGSWKAITSKTGPGHCVSFRPSDALQGGTQTPPFPGFPCLPVSLSWVSPGNPFQPRRFFEDVRPVVAAQPDAKIDFPQKAKVASFHNKGLPTVPLWDARHCSCRSAFPLHLPAPHPKLGL